MMVCMYVHDTYSSAYHIADEVELNNDINYEEDRSETVLVVGIHHHIRKAEGIQTLVGMECSMMVVATLTLRRFVL